MVALLVFIIATLERVFGRKKLFDAKGPFGDYVIKNPARFKLRTIFFHTKIGFCHYWRYPLVLIGTRLY